MKITTQQAISNQIGSSRFNTYLTAAKGKRIKALNLYLWNLEVAAAIISTTSIVEVNLRNTIDEALKNWNSAQSYVLVPGRSTPYDRDWLADPSPSLERVVAPPRKPTLQQISRNSMKDINGICTKPNPTHDDYVAGLTFGTWTSLLPKPNATSASNIRVRMWNEELKNHFAHDRYKVYEWANTVRYARNRASHLEPLLDVEELKKFHRASVRLLNSMSPETADWVAGRELLPKAVREKP